MGNFLSSNRNEEGTLSIDTNRLKVLLKLCQEKFTLAAAKKRGQQQVERRKVAAILQDSSSQSDSVRIRIEQMVREDNYCEALDMLQTLAQVLTVRLNLMSTQLECEDSIREAVSTLVFASRLVEIQELQKATAILARRFGKTFVEQAEWNANQKVIQKLDSHSPPPSVIDAYVEAISSAYAPKEGGQPSAEESSIDDILSRLDALRR